MHRRAFPLVLPLILLGCTSRTDSARARAASDFGCSRDKIAVTEVSGKENTFKAEGCDQSAVYICDFAKAGGVEASCIAAEDGKK
jgi:hypothetical protein